MKPRLLDVATVGTVLFCAFFLTRASWLKAAQTAPPREIQLSGEQDPFGTASALRYRRCQENHWRACVMQH